MADYMMLNLHEKALSCSILALYAYKEYIFVGEGSSLQAFHSSKGCRLSTFKLFSAAAIHGIKPTSNREDARTLQLLVWGQKSFTLVTVDLLHFEWNQVVREVHIKDWIIDAICFSQESSLIFATAHNCIIHCSLQSLLKNISNSSQDNCLQEVDIVSRKECSQNSLLYCGKITGSSLETCVVISGTPFGEIYLWAPWTAAENEQTRRDPFASLSGPKGPIFSITYNESNHLISTTSDDRSVRVWKVNPGFGRNSPLNSVSDYQQFWLNCSIQQVFCVYGHSARVWKSSILDDETIVSCSEDSTVCYWRKDGDLLKSWVAHPSATVWCMDNIDDVIFTGGGDGSVKKWTLKTPMQDFVSFPSLPCLSEVVEATTKSKLPSSTKTLQNADSVFNTRKNFPRSIHLLDEENVLTVWDDGSVWVYGTSENSWKLVLKHDHLRSYAVLAAIKKSSLVALGTLNGYILMLDTGIWKCVCEQAVSPSKLQALFYVDQGHLISSTGLGKIQIWSINEKDSNLCLQLMREFILPHCRQRWITAAAFFSNPEWVDGRRLVVGDACGSVCLYGAQCEEPLHSLKSLHGRNGVTCLKRNGDVLVSAGRDGHIRLLKVDDSRLTVLQERKIGAGSWICGIFKLDWDVIVTLFSGEKLQLWNIGEEELVFEVECGGGHRSWDILIDQKTISSSGELDVASSRGNEWKLTYGFLRNAEPVVWKVTMPDTINKTIKVGTSGRQIQCVEPLFWDKDHVLFTFGGEDTLLHTHVLVNEQLRKVAAVKSHLSSIRCNTKILSLDGKTKNPSEVYLLTCGGRAQFKVWKASLTQWWDEAVGLGRSSTEAHIAFGDFLNPVVSCMEIASNMLKEESRHSWKAKRVVFDPETRYMDSLALWATVDMAIFVLASSDGYIRFARFWETSGICNVFTAQDCQFCLLRLTLLKLEGRFYIVASTTRGDVILWNLETVVNLAEMLECDFAAGNEVLERLQFGVQMSGLNSLAAIEVPSGGESFLATGGDDGSIHLLRVISREKSPTLRETIDIQLCSHCSRHSGQVSGLVWLSESVLCSASTDQRLIVWRVHQQALSPVRVFFTSVPDVQGIRLLGGTNQHDANCLLPSTGEVVLPPKLFVFGAGIQVFEISECIK